MLIGDFEIKCIKCDSKNVRMCNYHNEYEEGVRIKCNKCGTQTEI